MRLLLAITVLALAGCPTSFTGSANTPDGPNTCQAKCSSWGMELVGMVSMGDNYTDGCICALPGKGGAAVSMVAAGTAAAAAGVVTQQRNAQRQQQ